MGSASVSRAQMPPGPHPPTGQGMQGGAVALLASVPTHAGAQVLHVGPVTPGVHPQRAPPVPFKVGSHTHPVVPAGAGPAQGEQSGPAWPGVHRVHTLGPVPGGPQPSRHTQVAPSATVATPSRPREVPHAAASGTHAPMRVTVFRVAQAAQVGPVHPGAQVHVGAPGVPGGSRVLQVPPWPQPTQAPHVGPPKPREQLHTGGATPQSSTPQGPHAVLLPPQGAHTGAPPRRGTPGTGAQPRAQVLQVGPARPGAHTQVS
jgi:hypothetical protein